MPLRNKKLSISSPRKAAVGDWEDIERRISERGCIWHSGSTVGLTGLTGLEVVKYAETDAFLYFFAKLEKSVNCDCGADRSLLKKHGWTGVLRIMDLPIHMKKVVIYYKAQRYRCSVCKQTWQSVSEQVNDSHRMTARLFKYIWEESMSTEKTFVSLEREVGINNLVVRNIQAEHTARSQKEHIFEYSPWIAIDEVHPTSRKEPRCVISAPLEDRVIDILINNDAFETLGPFLRQINGWEKIEVVSMDMHDPYRAVVRKALKSAKIVVDRFHVQKKVNDALKDVVSVIRWTLTREEREKYLCRESILLVAGFGTKTGRKLKRDSKIPAEEREKAMRVLFDRIPEVERAYELKEEFIDILDLWDFEKATHRARVWLSRAKEFMNCFYEKYERICLKVRKKPFGNVVSEFNQWFDEILNYVLFKRRFEKLVSNGYAENLNRKIKELNRKGYGYHIKVLRSKFVFGAKRSKAYSDPLKVSKKRRARAKSEKRDVNPNSNVCRIVDAYERADKTGELIPNPMEYKEYRDRSPLVKVETPREADNRGLPIPRSWRARRKAKVRDYNKERFNGGDVDDANSAPNQIILPGQLFMYQDRLKADDQMSTDGTVEGQTIEPSDVKVENSRPSTVSPRQNKKARRSEQENSTSQLSLFDLIPGTQNTLFRV